MQQMAGVTHDACSVSFHASGFISNTKNHFVMMRHSSPQRGPFLYGDTFYYCCNIHIQEVLAPLLSHALA